MQWTTEGLQAADTAPAPPSANVYAVTTNHGTAGRLDIAAYGVTVSVGGALLFLDSHAAIIHVLAPGQWTTVKRVR